MATNNMHNLTTLIKRLEAATARLEDIASSTIELPQVTPAPEPQVTQAVIAAPSSTPAPPLAPKFVPPPKVPEEPLPESIEEFDVFIKTVVEKYVAASKSLGGLVAEQANLVLAGFKEQRKFLLITTKAKKPDLTGSEMSVYQDLLKDINEAIMAAINMKESNRKSEFFNNLSAVAEGVMVLAWVTVDARPFKHVEETLGSAQFFGNRVLKEAKEKGDTAQIEWVSAFTQIFKDLTAYVRQYFGTGIPWNPKGRSAAEVAKGISSSGAPAPPAGGAPPPPPPPPPPPGPPPILEISDAPAPQKQSGAGFDAVFSELNKGEAVTAGLRKVDKSQMTHKNPSLRAGSTVPGGSSNGASRGKSPAPVRKPKPESMRVKKPPRKVLDFNKWTIENYEKEPTPIEIEATLQQSVLISKCNNCTVIIKGKANAVTVENTQRFNLIVDTLISSVDVVKSSNFALQVTGTIPTVMMDQIDGAQVYFSKESTSTKIYSSKSANINLNVLVGEGDDEDSKEMPLPSQICTYFDPEKNDLVNEIVEHAG